MTGLVASAALKGALSAVGSRIAAAWSWATTSAAHLLAVLLAIAVLFGFWQRHDAAKWHRVADSTEARRTADNKVWAAADKTNHATIATLIASLDQWSAATRQWAAVSKMRQQAAQAALTGATARGRALEALARRIDAEGVLAPQTGIGCRSGDAVMAAKGSL